ncbi:hypothetical protein [Neobacillus sp. D3-1R]|uniref:hypothetical protein n=1 Tax=Neobacillus sp. D3-1R TaxID=3445778 RepID=UPI003F9F4F5D
MLFRVFLLLTGFGLACTGGVSTIGYLNLLTMGNSVLEYLTFISKRIECYLLPIGIIFTWFSIYYPVDKWNDGE